MLIENFSFGNFRSFKDIQSLNMNAADIVSENKEIDKNNVIYSDSFDSLLKSKAIYGANASGKSNIVAAFYTFIIIVLESVKRNDVLLLSESFKLLTSSQDEPTFFQLIFTTNKKKYRYGFEVTRQKVVSEWLFLIEEKDEVVLFIREDNKIDTINKKQFEEGYKLLHVLGEGDENQVYRDNALFLSTLVALGFGKISKLILESFESIIIIQGITEENIFNKAKVLLKDKKAKDYTINLLKYADVGLQDFSLIKVKPREHFRTLINENTNSEFLSFLEQNEGEEIVISSRNMYNENNKIIGKVNFNFENSESEGTKKIFELSPFLYASLTQGTPLIIDEFDARFHPLLTRKIVELFNSAENTNAQLIFITHDTNLLSNQLLRTDQIDFVEKDKFGASHLYTLVELEGVTSSDSFESDYIRGKYGAIPFLGDFNKLIYSTKTISKDA
ncbi:ATP-binding protein [Bernardetia sp. ABR2-2B]|uniref:AAA family ATPase n=1 Tax=Bernardetia sp. ABR2-2B TaxID=3127472 RepID=UPI0030D1CBAC